MVGPKRDVPQKAIGLGGSDFKGLVTGLEIIEIFIHNEDVVNHMVDAHMDDHFDQSKSGDARECVKSGVTCALETLMKNFIEAAESAKAIRDS